jgi:hypothetical protein
MKSQHYSAPKWRFRHLIQSLGSYNQVASLLQQRGYPLLPESTVTAWAHRNSIPSSWLPAVIALALEGRVIGSIDDLKERKIVKRRTPDPQA